MTIPRIVSIISCYECPHCCRRTGGPVAVLCTMDGERYLSPLSWTTSIPDWCPLPLAGEYPNQDNPRAPDCHVQDNERRLADEPAGGERR